MFKKEIRLQILALFLLSLGGWNLHYKIHTLSVSGLNIIPLIVGGITTLALPFMFAHEKTVRPAFFINIAAIVIGTIMMGLWTVKKFADINTPLNLYTLVFAPQSTLCDIVILWAKFPLGLSILRHFPAAPPRV
jgi:hypothetical protein